MKTIAEVKASICNQIEDQTMVGNDWGPDDLAVGVLTALAEAGLVIGFLITDDEPSEAGLALVRVIPNE